MERGTSVGEDTKPTLVGEGNETLVIRVWKPLPSRCVFKNLEGKSVRESLKRTISASDRLGLLQMISEPDTGRCASEDTRSPKGWIVRSHIN